MPRAHRGYGSARWRSSTAGGRARAARATLENDGSRAVCPSCGSIYYANSAPCVSALVEDDDGPRACSPDGRSSRTGASGIRSAASSRRASTRSTACGASCSRRPASRCEPDRFLGAWMDVYGDAPEAAATLNLYWTMRIDGRRAGRGRRRRGAPVVRRRRAARDRTSWRSRTSRTRSRRGAGTPPTAVPRLEAGHRARQPERAKPGRRRASRGGRSGGKS